MDNKILKVCLFFKSIIEIINYKENIKDKLLLFLVLQSSMNESQTPTTSSSLMTNENLFASSASITTSIASSAKTIPSITSMMTSAPSIASSMQLGSMNNIKTNKSPIFSTKTLNSSSAAAAAASITALLSKLSNEQLPPPTNFGAEFLDPALLLAELGVGNVEELAQNELFKSLIQSMTNRKDELSSTSSAISMHENVQLHNNEFINALIAQSNNANTVKSTVTSPQSNNRISNTDFVASAF